MLIKTSVGIEKIKAYLFPDFSTPPTFWARPILKRLEIFWVVGVCFHFMAVKAILQSYAVLPVGGDP